MQQLPADLETFKRWTIGKIRVTRVLELPPTAFDPAIFIQATRREILDHGDWLCPSFATDDGDIILHFQAFIIEAGGKRIMVDPCIGNDKPRGHPLLDMLDNPFLERLERAGFPRESIDVVLCTHLHVDHCGWNTMLVDGRWVPTFPNARYLFARREIACAEIDSDGDAAAIYQDSVQPIMDAGLAELVDPGHVIVEGVRLEATPGHTPGHCSIVISSGGHEAIITGDVIHHPVQAALPHVSSNFCQDEAVAIATRRSVLAHAADHDVMLLVAHFAGSSGVYVRTDGDAWTVEET
ncbi:MULTISPECIES: MBL fold metallo-hydrolase [unclassified Sphingomonas]|uniref:MBL fold metallo-hydrolase n=1 Tax=unclassified Sphingomonas TaxID=196159 RepID=UPI0006F8B7E9|nr:MULTISPECIES: MBL fold metallo-hydrolase [unclassified Sphingomonas]KQX23247.1 hypothetical protein ASD17_02690 [Sphingomonas sp. Root1294]KQY68095.1 hypothetical protein ASD39_05210 [Sphingomonas sp. Root50]KRB90987.1 hypothetical protein ASE22_12010 [Sphingomonas sp. Root720]